MQKECKLKNGPGRSVREMCKLKKGLPTGFESCIALTMANANYDWLMLRHVVITKVIGKISF